MASTEQKMSRMQLTAMVVGGMVGAGIFSLPRTFANATGPHGRGHRVDHRGHRHVHAGACVPGAGRAQARHRCRRLCVRQGRLRRLPGLPLGVRLLDRQLHRQRVVLGAHQVHARRFLSDIRRRQYGDRDRGGLGRHLAVPFPDPARRAAGRVHQQHRHGGQGHSDHGLHRTHVLRFQDGPVPVQPLRRRPDGGPLRTGQGDDARHGVRVHRHRRGERVLAVREGTLGRRQGDDPRASSASPA